MAKKKGFRYEYPVHPLAALFPEIAPAEFRKLKDDIWKNGQQEPITLTADRKILVDGRNRLRACKELGIDPWTNRLRQSGDDYVSSFIWSANVMRRHLTADQRAAIGRKWSAAERQAAKERQQRHAGTAPGKSKDTSGESAPSVRARKAIAEKAQVSEHKIRQAEAVAKEAPHLLPKIESGELKLKDAVKRLPVKVVKPKVVKPAPPEPDWDGARADCEARYKESGTFFNIPYPDGDHAQMAVIEYVVPFFITLKEIIGPLFDRSGREITFVDCHPCYGVIVKGRDVKTPNESASR